MYERNKTNGIGCILPKLSMEAVLIAENDESVAWVWGVIGSCSPGDMFEVGRGIILQKIAIDTIRCLRVFDEFLSLQFLSGIKAQCEKAGVYLEIDPYTVLSPVPEKYKKKDTGEISKKEVIEKVNQKTDPVTNGASKQRGYNFGVEVV